MCPYCQSQDCLRVDDDRNLMYCGQCGHFWGE